MAKVSLPAPRKILKTITAIDAAIDADGGARYRALLEKWLPKMKDAYRQDEDSLRSHFGLSSVGRKCDRDLWYGWRWASTKSFPARMLRLFNRGHREEASFLALLEMIGVHIHFENADGQDRVSAVGGHVGSALDGTLYGIPDMPTEWVLGEFKTHNTKSFCKVVAEGVKMSKPEHYAQMQTCMKLRGIYVCLYLAVNKNDDDIYGELIRYDQPEADHKLDRAARLVFAPKPPPKISDDPSDYDCRYCDRLQICHYNALVLRNCRTCTNSVPDPGGTWGCALHNRVLDKQAQMAGCDDFAMIPELVCK